MNNIRVMHVISEMGTGGAESLVVEMARRGVDAGWHCGVASRGGRRVDDLAEAKIPHFEVAIARRTLRGLVAARMTTARVLRSFRPDIVIAHNVSATLVTRLARPRAPVLTIFHGVTPPDYRNAARILSFASDRVVVVSDAIGNRLRQAGLRGVEVTTIRNAVTPPILKSRSEARSELDLRDDVPVALCLARMERPKRHDLLLDAWRHLPGEQILLLAGEGSQRVQLEQQAYPMRDRVRFLGNRSDVSTLLAAADVTVLISDSEGLPLAILESLAAGRPVVASDVGGVREVLGSGGGRCVPPSDVDSITAALHEMLHDEAAREEAAMVGLSVVLESHNPAKMMQRYQELVCEMVAPPVRSVGQ
jgi:glycosyltransferase involved in cell wall biosynthesis